jgi:hypothetical protein
MLGKFNKPLRFSIEFLTLAFLHIPETNNGPPLETIIIEDKYIEYLSIACPVFYNECR